jgi:hypothetical protein
MGMFLDLMREAFQNSWAPMEDLLGVQQRELGKQCCNLKLLKETMGKIGELGKDGRVRYQINVSYDIGWQKAEKTYDSLSGHGLMIGNVTKNAVAFQNYSTACGFCECHTKNYTGSSKGMEAKAALDCVKQVWWHVDIETFMSIICLDDDASTRAYLQHSFADLDDKNLPSPKTKKRGNKNSKQRKAWKGPPHHPVPGWFKPHSPYFCKVHICIEECNNRTE